jgi:hypothetical protein
MVVVVVGWWWGATKKSWRYSGKFVKNSTIKNQNP